MDKRRISGVIFDMDGVLCDSEAWIAEAARLMFLERYGTRVALSEFTPFVGTGEKNYLNGVAALHGITLRMPEDKDYVYQTYLRIIRGCMKPMPGALDFVARCRAGGLKTALATSADRIKMEGNLHEIGLPPAQFNAVVTGSDIRHPKPDPEVFSTAARLLGLDAADCLVVEDALHGITAAHRAGCACLAVATTHASLELEKLKPDFLYPGLQEALVDFSRIV